MNFANRRRGNMILGFSALTFVLGVLCSAVLYRSMDSYRATATATQRMQARAAAEGAAVLIAPQGPAALAQPLTIGDCTVTASPAAGGAIPLEVAVHPNGSERATLAMKYELTLAGEGTSTTIQRLELQL